MRGYLGYSKNYGPFSVIDCITATNIFRGTNTWTLIWGTTHTRTSFFIARLLLLQGVIFAARLSAE